MPTILKSNASGKSHAKVNKGFVRENYKKIQSQSVGIEKKLKKVMK